MTGRAPSANRLTFEDDTRMSHKKSHKHDCHCNQDGACKDDCTCRCHQNNGILTAALRIAGLAGWRHLSFSSVAEEAGVSLASVLRHYPTRAALLCAWGRHVDKAMLTDDLVIDAQETVRDRLFDLIMRRFDAMSAHKEAVRALLPSFGRDVSILVASNLSLDRSMVVTLEAAGVDVVGARGLIQMKGLKGVYLYAMRAWLKDDTSDLAQTMAALDKALDRADTMANSMFGRGGKCRKGDDATETFASPS